ncbi:kinase-like protein [Sarocladium strictum]
MAPPTPGCVLGDVRFIPLTYDSNLAENGDPYASARKLIHAVAPEWAEAPGSDLKFIRFTDGITNTLLKVINQRPGLTKADLDREAILLRAYGKGTAVLIDREREAANHELLMRFDLAPALLARFENGMLYRYISGTPATHHDLRDRSTLLATARRLAQWHATVPCFSDSYLKTNGVIDGLFQTNGNAEKKAIDETAPGKAPPNLWTVMHKWILALPRKTQAECERQDLLLQEMKHLVDQLSQRPGLGENGLVFAHCDLLCANIIMHKDKHASSVTKSVSFIDYEYATPSPAAFDIANHFAEWAGYDCDYTMVPTRDHRQAFISEYVKTYLELSGEPLDHEEETRKLFEEVDVFRGVPGFYWGIWSSIQATISEIDFDYAAYAESRLGEYWAHKAEADGSRAASGKEMPLRERTWAAAE